MAPDFEIRIGTAACASVGARYRFTRPGRGRRATRGTRDRGQDMDTGQGARDPRTHKAKAVPSKGTIFADFDPPQTFALRADEILGNERQTVWRSGRALQAKQHLQLDLACGPRCRAARPYPQLGQTPISRHRKGPAKRPDPPPKGYRNFPTPHGDRTVREPFSDAARGDSPVAEAQASHGVRAAGEVHAPRGHRSPRAEVEVARSILCRNRSQPSDRSCI
jgi:hypothetical protein